VSPPAARLSCFAASGEASAPPPHVVTRTARGGVRPSAPEAISTRSLELLRAIEETVSNLSVEADLLRGAAQATAHVRAGLVKTPPERRIDPEGRIDANLSCVLDKAAEIYADWKRRRQSAIDDPLLTEGDGVADGYEKAMDALRLLHDETQDLRELVAEHDCDFDTPTGEVFTSGEALLAAIRR